MFFPKEIVDGEDFSMKYGKKTHVHSWKIEVIISSLSAFLKYGHIQYLFFKVWTYSISKC